MKRWIKDKYQIVAAFATRPVVMFVLIASLFGSLTIILSPPLTGADEEAHFVRAYGITEGAFILPHTNKVNTPESFRKTIGCFQSKTSQAGVMYQYRYDNYAVDKKTAFVCAGNVPLAEDQTEKVATSASFYSPTAYIPQVLAVLVGRLFDMPIVWMSYLVRFAVLAAFIVMVALAIRILPVRKWALVGVALLPHSIIHVTNPGADYMLLGLAALFVALIVRSICIPKEELAKEHTVILTGLAIVSVLIMLPKGFFPGICFLPLLMFYGGLTYKVKQKITVLAVAIIVALAWQKIGAPLLTGQSVKSSTSVLDLPAEFIKTMFYRWTDTDFIYTGDIVKNYYFSELGSKVGMPALTISLMNMLLAMYLFVGYPERIRSRLPSRENKLFIVTGFFIALMVVLGSFAALYIASADMQDGTGIRGVQPRYFYTAFILLAIIPFVRPFITLSKKTYIIGVLVGSIIFMLSKVVALALEFKWGIF